MKDAALEAIAASGLALRLVFVWRGDRFGHLIASRRPGGDWQPLLESVEGTAADDWPPSPPLQSLSIERLGHDRLAALLVGMAGRGHWSASMEAVQHEAKLVFDIACRHAGSPGWLGSRYRWLVGPLDRSPLAITAIEGVMGVEGVNREEMTIRPSPQPVARGPARWRFELTAV
jgi:hypothetical protein